MTRLQLTSIGLIAATLALPTAASAQDFMPDIMPLDASDVRNLPADLRDGPRAIETRPIETRAVETGLPALPDGVRTVGADGVETITRTRRIDRAVAAGAPRAPISQPVAGTAVGHAVGHSGATYAGTGYRSGYGYPAGAQVFSREQWVATCEDRTRGRRGKEKGGIIGGLLGAVAGGILGNRVFDSERLGGTLLGAGVGGLGGVLLGSLIGGGRNDRGEYDCEAALDGYLSQHAHGGGQFAARSIPAPAPVYAAPQYYPAPQYYAPQYYTAPQQIVYVPVEYQQRQRVVVRETVREEVIPGATRTIPAPAPRPIKTAPRPVAPRPIKTAPRLIKGN